MQNATKRQNTNTDKNTNTNKKHTNAKTQIQQMKILKLHHKDKLDLNWNEFLCKMQQKLTNPKRQQASTKIECKIKLQIIQRFHTKTLQRKDGRYLIIIIDFLVVEFH